MRLSIGDLKNRQIRSNNDESTLPGKVEIPESIKTAPSVNIEIPETSEGVELERSLPTFNEVARAASTPQPAPSLSSTDVPGDDEEVEDIEAALKQDEAEQSASPAPAKPAAPERPGPASWAKARYGDIRTELKRKASLPGKVTPTYKEYAVSMPVTNCYSYRGKIWDSRLSFFGDFYADPLKYWNPELLRHVQEMYLAGTPLNYILARVIRQRKKSDPLPPFTANDLGPLRLIDIYAVLYTCALIPMGKAFPDDPRYQQFGMKVMRPAIIDEENPSNTELPLPLFIEAYSRFAKYGTGKYRAIAAGLANDFPQLHPLQISNTLCNQLYKSIARRLLSMRKTQPHAALPQQAAAALLKSVADTGIAFRHGGQTFYLAMWPKEKDIPLEAIPGQYAYPLAYLLEALPSLRTHIDEPAYEVLQHLRNLLTTYREEGRPATLTDMGTLPIPGESND